MQQSEASVLRDRRLYAVFSITLIAVMGVASITPALPKMAAVFGLDKTHAALLISAFTLPGVFLTPLAGITADRFGRKTVLIPSRLLFACAGVSIFFLRNRAFRVILVFRVLQGSGAAALGALNNTLIGDFFKGGRRSEAMGYNASFLSLATALYPLIGGALAGFAWFFPFLLPLLAIPAAIFIAVTVQEPDIHRAPGFGLYLKSIAQNICRREAAGLFLISTITFTVLYGSFTTYNPFLLAQRFGLSSPQIGFFISLSSVTTVLIAAHTGRMAQRFGHILPMKAGFVLYFVVNIWFASAGSLLFFAAGVLLFGVAQGLNLPNMNSAIADLAPDAQRGAFMSLNGTMLRLGQTIGPLVVGFGDKLSGVWGAYGASAAISVIGFLILCTMLRPRRKAI